MFLPRGLNCTGERLVLPVALWLPCRVRVESWATTLSEVRPRDRLELVLRLDELNVAPERVRSLL